MQVLPLVVTVGGGAGAIACVNEEEKLISSLIVDCQRTRKW